MPPSSSSGGSGSGTAHKPNYAKSHQHYNAAPKVKPAPKLSQSITLPVAPISSFVSVPKLAESVQASKAAGIGNSSKTPISRPKLPAPLPLLPKPLPSYTSPPLPPIISHDINISSEDELELDPDLDLDPDPDASLLVDSLPPPTCEIQCCSYSYSILWESGFAIRFMIRRTRPHNRQLASKQPKGIAEHDPATNSKVSLNLRVPALFFVLVFVLIACWSFIDVSQPRIDLDAMLRGSGASKSTSGAKHLPSGKTPPAMRQFYHFPDVKNSSLISSDATTKSINTNFGPVIAAANLDPDFLSTPYLVVATNPTGATASGLHVPCKWVEERYGSAEHFAELTRIIELVRKGIEPDTAAASPPSPPSAVVATQTVVSNSTGPFIHTERSDAVHLLDSVGIFCQTEEMRDRCELDGGMSKHSSSPMNALTSVEISRLHRWFLALPEDARYEEPVRVSQSASTPPFVVFNKFTGVIATLNCRNKVRYGAPFAKNDPASIYIELDNNALPPAYAEFIANRCTKEAREVAIKAESAAAQHAKDAAIANKTSPPEPPPEPLPVSEPPKRAKWVEPLIPLLPPICSAASFSRPSLARACLRNSRIISVGDSTLQELMITLIDYLEQDDGEDPNDLTRMLVDDSQEGRARSPQQATEWMPPNSGSDGQPRYLIMEHWATPDSCKLPAITHMTRIFSTARFPTPYLAAYNITITHQWNLDEDICVNNKGPNWASSIALHRMAYRRLAESCLPENALEIVEKYRRKPDGTLRNMVEYYAHVNSLFHYLARDGQIVYKEDPPPFGCKYPYLTPEEYNQLTLPEWQLHTQTVPNFDYAIMNMGAHQARSWDNADNQRGETGYSYNPEQYHHALEAHVTLVQSIARHVVIRETAWREDVHFGRSVPAMNVILREVALEAQVRALQKEMEIAQIIAAARAKGVDLVPPVRRSVSWFPTYYHTTLMEKEDPVHCSYKLIWGGNGAGDTGIRTAFCYSLLQKIIQLFCAKK